MRATSAGKKRVPEVLYVLSSVEFFTCCSFLLMGSLYLIYSHTVGCYGVNLVITHLYCSQTLSEISKCMAKIFHIRANVEWNLGALLWIAG